MPLGARLELPTRTGGVHARAWVSALYRLRQSGTTLPKHFRPVAHGCCGSLRRGCRVSPAARRTRRERL